MFNQAKYKKDFKNYSPAKKYEEIKKINFPDRISKIHVKMNEISSII
jgi:hypothetical protein